MQPLHFFGLPSTAGLSMTHSISQLASYIWNDLYSQLSLYTIARSFVGLRYIANQLASYIHPPLYYQSIQKFLQLDNYTHSQVGFLCIEFSIPYSIQNKPEPTMLSVLPIIPSKISHNFYPLFLFYSYAITYYSCYIP